MDSHFVIEYLNREIRLINSFKRTFPNVILPIIIDLTIIKSIHAAFNKTDLILQYFFFRSNYRAETAVVIIKES